MKARLAVPMLRAAACVLISLFCAHDRAVATTLYDMDFTSPDVGSYSVVFGSPTIAPTFDGLVNALVLHARVGYEQIRLPIGAGGPGYQLDFDVVTHGMQNTDYNFNMLVDSPGVHSAEFFGHTSQMLVYPPYTPLTVLQPFVDDTIYHLGITLDLTHHYWSVSVGNSMLFSNYFGDTVIDGIRFSCGPQYLPGTTDLSVEAAIDNIRVTTIPEPSVFALTLSSLAVLFGVRKGFRPPRT